MMCRLWMVLLCAGLLQAADSTHNASWQRTLSANAAFVGDSIQFTMQLVNNEADTLHGFYFAEHIPANLIFSFENIFMGSRALSEITYETTTSSALYPETSTQRCIIETPPNFAENNAIPTGDTLIATFSLTSQTANEYTMEKAHWVGTYARGTAAFATSDKALTVTFIEKDLTILENPLPDGTVDESYQATLQANGGTPPYTWFLSNGNLPQALTLDSLSGTINGIPQQAGDFSFEISVRDSGLIIQQAEASFTLHVESTTALTKSGTGPSRFALLPAYPNPFNPTVTLSFTLPKAAFIELMVVNSLGQPLRRLLSSLKRPGLHRAIWDGKDEKGEFAGSGIYYVILKSSGRVRSHKILLIR